MARQTFVPFPKNKPKGYSPATRVGNMVFVSGQVAVDEEGNSVGAGDVRAQTEQVFSNMEAALKSAGAGWDDVTKLTGFLVNAEDFPTYSAVRLERFPDNGPASSTVIVKALGRPELLVEVEAIAVV